MIQIKSPYSILIIDKWSMPLKGENRICKITVEDWEDCNDEDDKYCESMASMLLNPDQIKQVIDYLQELLDNNLK